MGDYLPARGGLGWLPQALPLTFAGSHRCNPSPTKAGAGARCWGNDRLQTLELGQ